MPRAPASADASGADHMLKAPHYCGLRLRLRLRRGSWARPAPVPASNLTEPSFGFMLAMSGSAKTLRSDICSRQQTTQRSSAGRGHDALPWLRSSDKAVLQYSSLLNRGALWRPTGLPTHLPVSATSLSLFNFRPAALRKGGPGQKLQLRRLPPCACGLTLTKG